MLVFCLGCFGLACFLRFSPRASASVSAFGFILSFISFIEYFYRSCAGFLLPLALLLSLLIYLAIFPELTSSFRCSFSARKGPEFYPQCQAFWNPSSPSALPYFYL